MFCFPVVTVVELQTKIILTCIDKCNAYESLRLEPYNKTVIDIDILCNPKTTECLLEKRCIIFLKYIKNC